MPTIFRKGLLVSVLVISLLHISGIASFAKTVSYTYDDLNRLVEVIYGDGSRIQYTYDAKGNRISKTIQAETTPPTTTAIPAGGLYNSAQSVTLSCNDGSGSGCDKIYFTTDGSIPTTSSTVYSSPINISATTTLKFFAKDLAGNSESVKTQTYIIDTTPPTTTATPIGGTYNSAQAVTLSCNDGTGSGCDKTYYTTDGTTPTISSLVHTSLIPISAPTTLKFFSRDLAGNNETVKSQSYTILNTVVTVQLKDSNGNPISGGTVQYYSGGWKAFGTTDANGRASKELQRGTYSFSMTYAYGRQEKSQNIGNDPIVVFQTKAVSIQLKDSTGAFLDIGTVQYYAGGWRDIGSTSGGQITKELLPGSYSFSMTYAYGRQEKAQNIGNDPMVVFQTGKVHSDSGSCTNYFAGGWRQFIQDMELIPGNYTFRFNDGITDKSYSIIGGPVNQIH